MRESRFRTVRSVLTYLSHLNHCSNPATNLEVFPVKRASLFLLSPIYLVVASIAFSSVSTSGYHFAKQPSFVLAALEDKQRTRRSESIVPPASVSVRTISEIGSLRIRLLI